MSHRSHGAARVLWSVPRPDGHRVTCVLERDPVNRTYMVVVALDGQHVGGHRFETTDEARQWAHEAESLFREMYS
ncbi:MAG: hypothetical protein AB7N65_25830 [Vicinamibacterales bacterium]